MSVSIYNGSGSEDDLNFANANFLRLMDLVGVDVDRECLCGTWDGPALRELRDALQFALTSIVHMPDLDNGRATVVHQGPFGCTSIDCGLPAGYFHRALTSILKIVNDSLTAGVPLHYA
jgi:hypothetical protein